jgi:hypothetical protein
MRVQNSSVQKRVSVIEACENISLRDASLAKGMFQKINLEGAYYCSVHLGKWRASSHAFLSMVMEERP